MHSPETPRNVFDPEPLYDQVLAERPEVFRDVPKEELIAIISQVAEELRILEEVGEREAPRIEISSEEAKKIGAIWVPSGVGTYDIPLKPKERDVYKQLPWIQWADRERLNHAAILARKVAEARSGNDFSKGSLVDIEERKKGIKAAIEQYGPDIIYNGTELENATVASVLQREGNPIPQDRVSIIDGTDEHPIINTTDNIRTFKFPSPLKPNEELAIVAHAPHLVRVMRIINKFKPFPEGTKVRLFPLPTAPEGKSTYRDMEIIGVLNYIYRKHEATSEPYPYTVGESSESF